MQLSHKLLIRCMGALKSGVKSGNAEHKATGDNKGMVKALVELASFCDEQLRLKEDEGNALTHTDVRSANILLCETLIFSCLCLTIITHTLYIHTLTHAHEHTRTL